MDNLAHWLHQAGSSMDKVVKCTVFLKSMGDFALINEIYIQVITSEWGLPFFDHAFQYNAMHEFSILYLSQEHIFLIDAFAFFLLSLM